MNWREFRQKPMIQYSAGFIRKKMAALGCYWRHRQPWRQVDTVLLFVIILWVFLVSSAIGYFLTEKGYYGFWYQHALGPVAIQVYNNQGLKYANPAPDSNVARFLANGAYSGAPDTVKRITARESKVESGQVKDPILFQYYGLSTFLGWWWKLIGFPSWPELILGVALFHAVTIGLCYVLFRQFSGIVLSAFFALLLGMNHVILFFALCNFRDSSRFLFIVATCLLLVSCLKNRFTWRKVIVVGLLGGAMVFVGMGFRNDFLFLIPFVIGAIFLFHGKKIWSEWQKKTVCSFLLIGLPLLMSILWIPPATKIPNGQHVTYIGLAPELLDSLGASNPSYYWGRWYSDMFGFIAGNAIGYHRYHEQNGMPSEPGSYARALNGELGRLAYYFPYDLAMSAVACIFNGSPQAVQRTEKLCKMTPEVPFYRVAREFSAGVLEHIPSWCVTAVMGMFLFLIGCFSFRKFLFFLFLGMLFLGMYAIQFSLRHYYFHFMIPCICAAFTGALVLRLMSIGIHFRGRAFRRLYHAASGIKLRVIFMLLSLGILCGVFWGLKLWQNHIVTQEVKQLSTLEKTHLAVKPLPISEIPANVVSAQKTDAERPAHVFLTFPDLAQEKLKQKHPDAPWNSWGYGEYLVCYFDLKNFSKPELEIGVHYELPEGTVPATSQTPVYLNKTRDFSEKRSLPVSSAGEYMMVIPIYFSHISRFKGIELDEEDSKTLNGSYLWRNPAEMFAHIFIWSPLAEEKMPAWNRSFSLQEVFQLKSQKL